MFSQPLRIPYVSREVNNSANNDPESSNMKNGSFVNNSVFMGQSRTKTNSDSAYYTVGSLELNKERQ